MAENKPRKLTLREMSEKGMLPRPIPHQLAFLFESLIYFFEPRRELEAKRISGEEAEKVERKHFCTYSRLRAKTYRAYADYSTGKNIGRFLRKARNSEEMAEKYDPQPVLCLEELE